MINRPFLRFYAVGFIGVAVQLATLSLLTSGLHMHHSIATVLAVQTAVLHNFLWHERWTWACRRLTSSPWQRYCKFNLTTGLSAMVVNVIVTGALVELMGAPYLLANLLAIASASIANYLISDLFVFRS